MNSREVVLNSGLVLEFDGNVVSKVKIDDLHVFLVKEDINKSAILACTNEGGEVLWTRSVSMAAKITPKETPGEEGVVLLDPPKKILINPYTGEKEPFLL